MDFHAPYRESVKPVGNRLPAEFDAERIIAGILDSIKDAEGPVAVVLNIYVQVTETMQP